MKAVPLWKILVAGGVEAGEARKRSDAFAAAVKAGLTTGRFELRGFGAFTVRLRAARTGRNPMTGAAISIPAKTAVAFKAAPGMKKALIGEELAVKTPDRELQAIAIEIVKALQTGGDESSVKVEGLGTLRKALRSERVGRNPATGAEIKISASAAVLFKMDPSLAASIASAPASSDPSDEGDDDADEGEDEDA